jgi:uncharacterized protein (DUF2235 family)
MKQVWFPGVHCDVGGGYPEETSGLSKYALEWMLEEAKAAGLCVNEAAQADVLGNTNTNFAQAKPDACMHESLKSWWRLAEFVPKRHWNWQSKEWEHRMNLFRRRTIPAGSMVHESAYLRGDDYAKRIPPTAIRVPTRAPGQASSATKNIS